VRKCRKRETKRGIYIKDEILTSRLISFEEVKNDKNILFEFLHFDLLVYYHCWTIWKLKSISFVHDGINRWYKCMDNSDDYWTSIRQVPNTLFSIFIGHKEQSSYSAMLNIAESVPSDSRNSDRWILTDPQEFLLIPKLSSIPTTSTDSGVKEFRELTQSGIERNWNWFRAQNQSRNVQHRGIGCILVTSISIKKMWSAFNEFLQSWLSDNVIKLMLLYLASLIEDINQNTEWLQSRNLSLWTIRFPVGCVFDVFWEFSYVVYYPESEKVRNQFSSWPRFHPTESRLR
jgi:hypothetical protein